MSLLYLEDYVQEVIGNFVVTKFLFVFLANNSVYVVCLNMATKSEKDKQKAYHDKNQMILSGLLRDDDNKYCVDCDAKGSTFFVSQCLFSRRSCTTYA